MKIRRFFLCISLFLFTVAGQTAVARTIKTGKSLMPEAEISGDRDASAFRVSIWLFTGVMLGWTLLSLYMTFLARQELVKVLREE